MRFFHPNWVVVLSVALMTSAAFLWSCKTEKYPDNILTQQQFSSLLVELYLAEAKLNGLSIPRDSASKLFIPYEDSLMKKSGVPDSVLRNTYQYYFDHPQELEKVYEIVIDSLSLREKKDQKKPLPVN
jgi:nitrogen fixation-related uncharacterized protein